MKILLCLLLVLTATTSAAEEKRFGEYVVNYSVFNSNLLPPAMAGLYKVVRADDRILVNISIRKDQKRDQSTAQRAKVSGTSSDLIRKHPLEFREIVEREAVYYIADFKISREENRVFRISILPDGEYVPFELRFSKKLYAD